MRFIALFTGLPCFPFKGSVGLTIGLAIGGAVLIAGEIAVNMLGWFL